MNETLKSFNGDSYLWKEYGSIGNYTEDRVHLEGFIGPIPAAIRNNLFESSGVKSPSGGRDTSVMVSHGTWPNTESCHGDRLVELTLSFGLFTRGEGTSTPAVSINF